MRHRTNETPRQASCIAIFALIVGCSGCSQQPILDEAQFFPPPTSPLNAVDDQKASSQDWQSVGIGGGGAFFYPAASPHNSKLLFVSSDMGGFYRSENNGHSWQMLDWRNIPQSRTPIFHPTDPKTIYACAYHGDTLRVSRDAGITWSVVGGENSAWKSDVLLTLAFNQARPETLLLSGEQGIYQSDDEGKTWAKLPDSPQAAFSIYINPTPIAGQLVCFAATSDTIYRSDDNCKT